jgi:hypothetical protein
MLQKACRRIAVVWPKAVRRAKGSVRIFFLELMEKRGN